MKNKLALVESLPTLIQQKTIDTHLVTEVAKLLPSGAWVKITVGVPTGGSKAQRFPSLRELAQLGFSQKWAALFTGISQSYASKGLNQ